MKKIIITFLSFVLLFNINSFAQKNDPILQKLLEAAGDKMYLKDYPFELEPGEEKQFPVHLNKRTVYEWYAFLSEYKQFQITLFNDAHANIIFQNKETAIDIINFSIKSSKPGKYILNIKNTSDKPIKSTILLTYSGKFNPKKANVSSPILDKLLAASKNTMFLKDYVIDLESNNTVTNTVVLSKNTKYGFYFYQEEPTQLQFHINDKDDNSVEGGSIPAQVGITKIDYDCPKTGVYYIKIKNISNKHLETALLLTFIEKVQDEKTKELISPVTKQEENQEKPKLEYAEKDKSYYFIVDEMPKFNGKKKYHEEFIKFLNQKIEYPQEAIDKKIEGKVFVQFIISKDGYIKDAKVARGVHPALDQEALRIVYSSPKWEPGIKDGKPVDVILTFPIEFKLP